MKMFKVTLILFLAAGLPGFAQEEASTHMAGRDVKEPGRPGYQQVADEDKQMDRAVEHAQRSLGFFMAVLRTKKDSLTGIASSTCGLVR
jgi:hypothetical protein